MSEHAVNVGDGVLPRKPPRDNAGHGCTIVEDGDGDLPDHIRPCTCDEHDGVCEACAFKITAGPDGVERGHARSTNRDPSADPRVDCRHRPETGVDPLRSNARASGGGEA